MGRFLRNDEDQEGWDHPSSLNHHFSYSRWRRPDQWRLYHRTRHHYDDEGLTLQAPLRQNINHKSTAFAGSLNALLTLAGWGLLWFVLKERDMQVQIVIQESMSSYLRPVTCDFSAQCHKPDLASIARLETTLRKKGKAKLELQSEIREGDSVAVSFRGRYVVFLNERASKDRLSEFPGGFDWSST